MQQIAQKHLCMYTIYKHPADYPNKYVVRRSAIGEGDVKHDREPLIVAETLLDARAVIPWGLTCLSRHPNDEAQIFEVWF